MDKEKVKLIVKNMKLLITSLENELLRDEVQEYDYDKIYPYIDDDVDEYYSEEDNV